MKVAVRILFLFCVLFVLAGAGCMGAGLVLGGSFEEVSRLGGGISLNFWNEHSFGRIVGFPFARRGLNRSAKDESERVKDSLSFTGVENLYVDVTAGAVELLEGEGEEIFVESSSDHVYASMEEGTLKIQVTWKNWFEGNGAARVRIPSDYVFKKVTLTGTGSLECESLTADTVVINGSAADISIDDRLVAREKLEVKADAADVSIEQVVGTPLTVLKANVGNIDITFAGSRSDYAIEKDSNLGDITVENEEEGDSVPDSAARIQAKCNVGNIDIDFEK